MDWSSSGVVSLGVPIPESIKNMESLNRETSAVMAFPVDNRKLEFDFRNNRFM